MKKEPNDDITPEHRAAVEALVGQVASLAGCSHEEAGRAIIRETKRIKKFRGKTPDQIEEMYAAGECEESELPLAIYQRLNKGR